MSVKNVKQLYTFFYKIHELFSTLN